MFKQAWDIVLKAILLVGVLLTLLVGLELLRAFIFFYRFRPWLGWVFAGVVLALALAVPVYFLLKLRRLPRVLKPPRLTDSEKPRYPELVKYCRYLERYLSRLAANSRLADEQRAQAAAAGEQIADVLDAHPLLDDLVRVIMQTETEVILPLLAALEDQARREVRTCVRDVMLAVTLCPYPSVDLMIVLYRNCAMILRLARLYAESPAP